ncbi:MAG TPA: fibronectin type III domain-containing protein [Candidatus Polarisedimenticolaceae bacterium]
MNSRRRGVPSGLALVGLVGALSAPVAWSAPEPFPTARPSTRLQAVAALSAGAPLPQGCATLLADGIETDPARATPPARRALALLQADRPLAGERRHVAAEGVVVRYAADRGALDRVDGPDGDADGVPDLVEAAAAGALAARDLLVRRLEFPAPGPIEVVLARLGSGVDGLLATSRDGHRIALVDPWNRGGVDGVRRAAAHQVAHAIADALVPGPSGAWSEAFATWSSLTLDAADEKPLALVAGRLAGLDGGLAPETLEEAAGNAVWLAFLHEAYGPTTLRLAMDELGRGGQASAAFERALRRGAGSGLAEALREFHVWSILTGERDDRRHFAFAEHVPSPSFAERADGLPAVSILGEPALGPAGLAQIALRAPDEKGGLLVRFEGESGARLAADLLLVRTDGSLRRVALTLDSEGRGDAAVPMQGLREVLLLVRNLEGEEGAARRFSWFASSDPAYPWEPGSVSAESGPDGVQIVWETTSEAAVLGFNVLRRREGDTAESRVNPVWVPSIGDRSTPAQYAFVDTTAAPGVVYEYRVEAVTPLGLAATSDAAVAAPRR